MTIPKIIHQVWLQGHDKIPTNLKIYHDGCKNINDNFESIFWDEVKIKKFLLEHFGQKYVDTFNLFPVFAQKTDFARYAILYIHGGIYLDMDTLCRKNLSPFLGLTFFTTIAGDGFYEIYKRYHNAIIGTVPKHPLFKIILKNIFDRLVYLNNVTYSTGTRLFYDSVKEYRQTYKDDITIVDPKYLHPCGIFNNELCPFTCDDCYVSHINYSSWSPVSKSFQSIVKNFVLILIIIVFIIIGWVCYRKFKKS